MSNKPESKTETKHFLAIDWGASRCGLAIADSETKIAAGTEEVETEKLLERVERLNGEQRISTVIVGKASHDGFEDNKELQNLEKELQNLDLKVEFEEEFFSTKQAQQNLVQTGKRGISKNDNIESARIILQGWLDSV